MTCKNYFNLQRKQALNIIILCSCSEMGAHVARAGRAVHKFQTFTGKPRQPGDWRRYQEDVKMYLKQKEQECSMEPCQSGYDSGGTVVSMAVSLQFHLIQNISCAVVIA